MPTGSFGEKSEWSRKVPILPNLVTIVPLPQLNHVLFKKLVGGRTRQSDFPTNIPCLQASSRVGIPPYQPFLLQEDKMTDALDADWCVSGHTLPVPSAFPYVSTTMFLLLMCAHLLVVKSDNEEWACEKKSLPYSEPPN